MGFGGEGYRLACEAWAAAFQPRAKLTVAEWADQHRKLTSKTSGEAGDWRTDRVPFIREIMECLSPHHPGKRVVFMKSSQVAGTEAGLNWVGYTIHHDPSPMLCVLPTLDVGEKWSKQRLSSMIEASPALSKLIAPSRSRDSGNTTMMKEFPGGILIVAGANSASSLRSMPAKKLLCDEVDGFPESADDEGDPVKLAERRTSTFPRKKIFLLSTPTIESLSRINKEWLLSDQRRYFVPCPECGEHQVLEWENLRADEANERAWFVCTHHGCIIEEHHKTSMLAAGQWRAQNPGSNIAGFNIWAAYTPIGLGDSWVEIMQEWARVKGDPEQQKVFINTYRGECFKDPTEKLDWEVIKSRAEAYPLRTVPGGCLILTAGIDVQGNRLAVQIVGWGANGQVWPGIDWVELPGDPTRPEVWNELDRLLQTPLVNRFGVSMKITAAAVDSGYLPDDVLRFVRPRAHRNVYAVKGSSIPGRAAVSAPQQQDRKASGKQMKHGVRAWSVGTDSIKAWLFLILQDDGKHAHAHERRAHFSDQLPVEYFTQLCAEIYDPHKKKWVKQQARNEALDTLVYARWAAMSPKLRVHLMREHDWLRFAAVIEPATGDLFAGSAQNAANDAPEQPKADEKPAVPHETRPNKPRIVPRKNWVTGFKK